MKKSELIKIIREEVKKLGGLGKTDSPGWADKKSKGEPSFREIAAVQKKLKDAGLWKGTMPWESYEVQVAAVNKLTEGFMGTDHWTDADTSSDLYYVLANFAGVPENSRYTNDPKIDVELVRKYKSKIINALQVTLKTKTNQYNVSGAMAIAMIANSSTLLHSISKAGVNLKLVINSALREVQSYTSSDGADDFISSRTLRQFVRALKSVK